MKVELLSVGRLGTNCYLVVSAQKNAAIIDPGAQAEKIEQAILDEHITPRMILLTHSHFDHIGAVKELCDRYQIPVYIHPGELDLLKRPHFNWSSTLKEVGQHILNTANLLQDGQMVALDEVHFRAVLTPGHTPGSVVFLCGEYMFSGDTLFLDDVGRCDLEGGNYPEMKRSLAKLAALEGDYTVCPGHGESTTLQYERRHNHYINQPMPREDI
jgi:Zn-dependent hydrolases, including glyoxylases